METDLAAFVRESLVAAAGAVREVPMFGGIGFMVNGNLLAGASHRGLLLRVGREREGEALARPGARPMVMRGRTLRGYVYLDPPGLTAGAVRGWVELALAHVLTLPPKATKQRARKAARSAGPAARAGRRKAARRSPAREARERPRRRPARAK